MMKRYSVIFTLFFLCIVPQSISAETCYVLNESGEKSFSCSLLWQERFVEYDLSGKGDALTFEARKQYVLVGGVGKVQIQQKINGEWKTIAEIDPNKSYASYGPYTIDKNATAIRFFNNYGSYDRYFQNVKVTMAKFADAPKVTSLTFPTKYIGESASDLSTTMEWCNVESITGKIEGEGASQFSFSISNNATTCAQGTATIKVTYKYDKVGQHNAQLILTANGTQYTIQLFGYTDSHVFLFDRQDGNWNEPTNWTHNGVNTHGKLPTSNDTVIISKACVLSSHAEVLQLKMQEGGSLQIANNGGLSVYEGGFSGVDASNLTIQNTPSGAGYIKVSSSVSVMPTATILYTPKSTADGGVGANATYQYMGAPGANVSFSMNPAAGAIFLWNEPTDWQMMSGSFTMTPFAGYAITQFGQPTYTMQTQLLHTPQIIQLTNTETGVFKGENLFANSFMAPIDVRNFESGDITGNVDKTLYVYNTGSYEEWEQLLGKEDFSVPGSFLAIPIFSAAYLDSDETTIAPMQGVMIKANQDGATLLLQYDRLVWSSTYSNSNRPMHAPQQHGEASEVLSETDSSLSLQRRIRMVAMGEQSGAKRIYLLEDSAFTAGYDNGYDAPQYYETDNLLRLYTNEPFGQMEVSATDRLDSMFVGFHAGEDTRYTLTFSSVIGDSIYLMDTENSDSLVYITEGSTYEFLADPFSTNDFRFRLLIGDRHKSEQDLGKTTSVEAVPISARVWCNGQQIFVSDAAANSSMNIYTLRGERLVSATVHHTASFSIDYLPRGIYILHLDGVAYKIMRP